VGSTDYGGPYYTGAREKRRENSRRRRDRGTAVTVLQVYLGSGLEKRGNIKGKRPKTVEDFPKNITSERMRGQSMSCRESPTSRKGKNRAPKAGLLVDRRIKGLAMSRGKLTDRREVGSEREK